MPVVSLDFETYSETDLKKVGAWAYACHPATEVLCMAYAIDDADPVLWLPGQPLPRCIIHYGQFTFRAWNSFFEWCIWMQVLHWPKMDIAQWEDTAARAAALAMPRKLGECGAAMGLAQDQVKDKRGSYLIQRLCKPFRGKRVRDDQLLQELYEYCKQDVIAERAIAQLLRPLGLVERQIWELDQTINMRGVYIDTESVSHVEVILEQATRQLNEEVSRITRCQLTNVSQRECVLEYVNCELGYPLIQYDKAYLASVLKDALLPPIARRLIEIRLQLGKTSIAKYARLQMLVTDDNRARGLLRYHGASTGRWSGQLFQPQNLPRSTFSDTDACIRLFPNRDAELLELFYDDPMEALSSCIRGMLCAPAGKKLIVADYAAIEARVLAWMAGQQDVLEVFKGHGMLYEHTASSIYKVPVEQVSSDQRFIGKIASLALGYQGGIKAFLGMASSYGVELSEDLADTIKMDWRSANRHIVRYWKKIEQAAIQAVQYPGNIFGYRTVRFRYLGDYLFCRLPSGRLLTYYQPVIMPGMYNRPQLTYMGVNSVTRKWERQNTYGGRLTENIIQAVARDLMALAMLRVEDAGYPVVLSVHDEIISEVDQDFGSVEDFKNQMCWLPHWAKGLPIKATGYESQRYRK